jgi:hypothetical protein
MHKCVFSLLLMHSPLVSKLWAQAPLAAAPPPAASSPGRRRLRPARSRGLAEVAPDAQPRQADLARATVRRRGAGRRPLLAAGGARGAADLAQQAEHAAQPCSGDEVGQHAVAFPATSTRMAAGRRLTGMDPSAGRFWVGGWVVLLETGCFWVQTFPLRAMQRSKCLSDLGRGCWSQSG